ncbi:hypothetical protein, partial [Nitratidesulfovibrio liaohensis]|uniref:hypothetical protein n=1 Tax=Nitratidesulfovibrio liaohensis TaxID=2604158 RepID=UPI001AAEA020
MFLSLVLLGGMAAVRVQARWPRVEPGDGVRMTTHMTKFGNHPPGRPGGAVKAARSCAGRARGVGR